MIETLEPLKGLDAIDWASVSHAYGAATDVPEQLQRLVGGDRAAHEEALDELFGNIHHQGTVYSATSVAVPFLVDLVAEPAMRSRGTIVFLLGVIARGTTYTLVREASDLSDPRKGTPEWEAMKASELTIVAKVRAAISDAFPRLVPLLRDDDEEVRAGAPFVLSAIPAHVEESRRALTAALDHEREERPRSAILLALGELSALSVGLWDRLRSSSRSKLELYAAALAVARTARNDCPASAIDAIIEGVRDAETFDVAWGRVPRVSNGATSDAMQVLATMQSPAADIALERLLNVLPAIDRFRVSSAVSALLELTFPGDDPVAHLSDLQRLVLRAVVSADAVWASKTGQVEAARQLKMHGLPGDRETLADLVK